MKNLLLLPALILALFLSSFNNIKTTVVAIHQKNVSIHHIGRKCWKCNGSGNCSKCLGSGKRTCVACNGTGEKPYYGYGKNPHETCTTCKGKGKVSCGECNGSGVCDLCKGTGTLN